MKTKEDNRQKFGCENVNWQKLKRSRNEVSDGTIRSLAHMASTMRSLAHMAIH